ncbi:ATP synthase, subunit E [Brevipalpus obovatus]|uniref:ATP synthase, subunit E n=1 Tax=Brevipalpus obovatus TaxID=246614 RepID=UPI003D9E1BBB
MSNAAALPPPIPVSPFIRLTRWTLFVSGIAWGVHRHRVNRRKEDEYQAYIAKMKPIWMENKRKILANRNREQMLQLGKETQVQTPKDFDKMYPMYPDAPKYPTDTS